MIKKSKTRERSATSTKVRSVPAGSPAARTASAVVGAGTWLARHTPQPQELGCSSGCFRSYEGAQSRGPSRPLQAIVLQSQKMLCCQPDPDNVEPSVPVRWAAQSCPEGASRLRHDRGCSEGPDPEVRVDVLRRLVASSQW